MVPQYSLAFRNEEEATRAAAEMREIQPALKGIGLTLDQNKEIVTISAFLVLTAAEFSIHGQRFSYRDLGFLRLEVEDHHSGCHTPEGSLIVYNSRTSKAAKQ